MRSEKRESFRSGKILEGSGVRQELGATEDMGRGGDGAADAGEPTPTEEGGPTRGLREPAFIRISVDPNLKTQFHTEREVETWRDRLAWDERSLAPFRFVKVPCVPGLGLPRGQATTIPAREWGQMSARGERGGTGLGVGSKLSQLPDGTSRSSKAQYFSAPEWVRPGSQDQAVRRPRRGRLVPGEEGTRGNPVQLWGERGRDERNAANWCSTSTAVFQRGGTPTHAARSRVYTFDADAAKPPERDNSYQVLSARIGRHKTTISPLPPAPGSPSHREGAWMGRAHGWSLDRGWSPHSTELLG